MSPRITAAERKRDDKALELRSDGSSFAAIARTLDLGKSINALEAFLRAISRRPAAEQDELRAAESARLDLLERQTKRNGTLEEPERDRRLQRVAVLRKRLATGTAG